MNSIIEFGENQSNEHPGLGLKFRLQTPVLKDVIKHALFRITMKQSGVIFYGPPRIGKTRCFKALRVEIPEHHPNTYIISMIAVARENARHISTIVNQLILAEGIEISRYASSEKVFNILVDRIVRSLQSRKKSHLILLFDELQRFGAADFFQLSDIVNVLDDQGIMVTVISFGMPELEKIASKFKDTKQLQIVSRFMSNLRPVSGICSNESLIQILNLYDADMFYPHQSNISYTQNFYPKSFATGWRLSKLGEDIWSEMHIAASGCYVNNLPMEHVATIVRYFYQISSVRDGKENPISIRDIRDAIEISGFREFCVAYELGLVE